MNSSLVIFLHGFGSRGSELSGLGQSWAANLPGTEFVAPDGPSICDRGGSNRHWFSVAGISESERPARVIAARPAFDAIVADILRQYGFTERLDRVAFVGFSQGAIMALDAVVSGRWPVGAVVAFSGRLAETHPFAPISCTRILLVHGEADRIMPVDLSAKAEIEMTEIGLQVSRHVLPGVEHNISRRGADLAMNFLKKIDH